MWLQQLANDPLLGLRNLDLLNVVLVVVALPLYLALYGALRRRDPGLSLLALVVVSMGAVLFVANNAALPMLELARRYAEAAPSDAVAIESAADALLARGAHGSFGSFPGFFVSTLGTLLMATAMLGSEAFGRAAGRIGVIGSSLLAVYVVAATFIPGSEALVMAVAAPGGLLMMSWNLIVARALLRSAETTALAPAQNVL
jgi:hypothetical protein